MKEIIKCIKKRIIALVNYIAWNKQYKQLVSMPRKKNFTLDLEWYKGCKILMMVPHADDELISSYTVLCNAEDITLYYCGFTGSNDTDNNRNTRRNEILKLCSELKVKVIEGNGNCDNLEEVIKQGNYDTILLPSIVDWHKEHRKISYMINEVCVLLNISPSIYCYSVTVPNESNQEVLCVPISIEQQKEKYDLFERVYLSQSFMPIERLKLNERINGYHPGCFAAETFLKFDFGTWTNKVLEVELQEEIEGSKIQHFAKTLLINLNNLVLVRRSSKEFYYWFEKTK